MRHYRCLSAEELATLPVGDIACPDAWLFFWATGPCLPQALSIIAAWGFKYSGSGFVWVKLRRSYDLNQLRLLPIGEADVPPVDIVSGAGHQALVWRSALTPILEWMTSGLEWQIQHEVPTPPATAHPASGADHLPQKTAHSTVPPRTALSSRALRPRYLAARLDNRLRALFRRH